MTRISYIPLDPELEAPRYAKPGDAGADLRSTITVEIQPGERVLVPTGIALALPDGFAAFIHPRSGLALRHGLSIVNTPGTIDAGYRGEIMVLLINLDQNEAVTIERGDRIAQMVIQRVETVEFVPVDQLTTTERGTGGYGSSGGHRSINIDQKG